MTALSIITPTFNRAGTLGRTLTSVLGQDCHDLEHIIVDNLSDDGTDRLVADYQRRAPYRVTYVRERDTGMYQAVNKGIRKSSGEWIHILNSDDVYASDRIVGMLTRREHACYDLLCGAVLMTDSRTGETIRYAPVYHEGRGLFDFPHPGTVIKKSFYEAHGYYDERFTIVSDVIFRARHYRKASYLILDEVVVLMGAGGLSTRYTARSLFESLYYVLFYHRASLPMKLKLVKGHLLLYLKGRQRGCAVGG